MAEFKENPVLILEDLEAVREFATGPDRRKGAGMDAYRIKSLWLISLIDEHVASGHYPYNSCIKKLAEQRMGFPPKPEAEYSREGDNLSLLIYNAQCYRRSDQLHADGFIPLTTELIERLGEGSKLELQGGTVLTIKSKHGRLYAMKPHARNYCVLPHGDPVRIVLDKSKSKKPAKAGV